MLAIREKVTGDLFAQHFTANFWCYLLCSTYFFNTVPSRWFLSLRPVYIYRKQLQQNRLQIVSAVHHSVPIAEQTNKQCTKATQKSAAQRRGRRLQQNLTCGRNHQPLCTRDCSPSRKLGLKACPSYPIKYSSEELKDVQRCSIELFKMESTLAEINPPIVIVGDIHGQVSSIGVTFSSTKLHCIL
ncbi:hypothetical protein KIN20_019623 [Parelaphostrongylus tenuis]|uniref:Uncharacterized protein n=1 Tax=Parelaphostrongylus tenuis TaxID=148309 RepID=A0AAD5MLB6_PARTN|nr:hypothetical protein KIN20_019623 [Parelaphostrongylus tenuis]